MQSHVIEKSLGAPTETTHISPQSSTHSCNITPKQVTPDNQNKPPQRVSKFKAMRQKKASWHHYLRKWRSLWVNGAYYLSLVQTSQALTNQILTSYCEIDLDFKSRLCDCDILPVPPCYTRQHMNIQWCCMKSFCLDVLSFTETERVVRKSQPVLYYLFMSDKSFTIYTMRYPSLYLL